MELHACYVYLKVLSDRWEGEISSRKYIVCDKLFNRRTQRLKNMSIYFRHGARHPYQPRKITLKGGHC